MALASGLVMASMMYAAYTAEPGSKSEEALNLLASWSAAPDEAHAVDAIDRG